MRLVKTLKQSVVFIFSFGVLLSVNGASNPPNANDSDPKKLGWMVGFPPPADKRIMQPQSNYFSLISVSLC